MARVAALLLIALWFALPVGAQRRAAEKPKPAASSKEEKSSAPQTGDRIAAIFGGEPEKWGVVAVRLRDGQVVYAHNPDQPMQPASNEKVFTTAAALDALGPEWRTRTSVYATEETDAAGVIHGDLVLYGRGDPNLSGRFNEEDPLGPLRSLAEQLAISGVKRVEGALVADDSYLEASPFGAGWSSEDLQWWFGAEVSALSFNDNLAGITVTPGAKAGDKCVVVVTPDVGYVEIQNDTTTGSGRGITVHRELDSNVIDVGGSGSWSGSVSVFQPALYAAAAFRRALADAGIEITGPTRRLGPGMQRPPGLELDELHELARLDSRPLAELIRTVNKHSQNLHAELLLRLLGRERGEQGVPSDEAGAALVQAFLERAGAAVDGMRIVDGSGLSRFDRASPSMLQRLAAFMDRHPVSGAFRHSLPVAGVDGTLRGRLSSFDVDAKTGSLETAKSLSGYLTTKSGERLSFAIVYNDARGTGDGIGKIDRIVAGLASL